LSKKYGVNPSVLKCFWCGKPMGVALMGRIKGDLEAPHEITGGLDACDECKEKFKKGVLIVEVNEDGSRYGNQDRFAIRDAEGNKVFPTGRFAVLRHDVIRDGNPGDVKLADRETMDYIFSLFPNDGGKAQHQADD